MANSSLPQGVARVIRWLVMLFIAYALFHSYYRSFTAGPVAAVPTSTAQPVKECAPANPLSNFSAIAGTLLPSYIPMIRSEDTKTGTGAPAICGQRATLTYEYATKTGTSLYKGKPDDMLMLDDSAPLHGITLGILGMKPGGTRTITIPPALAFGKKPQDDKHGNFNSGTLKLPQQVIVAKVALSSLTPAAPVSALPLRMLNTTISSGDPALCGDTVRADITVWKLGGTKLFSTLDNAKPLTFTLGKSQIAYGIEQAVLGLGEGASRTIILPPELTRPLLANTENSAILFPEHEVTLVEIKLLPPETPTLQPKP